jgi:uncharacterized protein with NAD-binding domain and iron-sulfur cluster
MIGCSSNSESEHVKYSVYIYDENVVRFAPPQEYSEQFEKMMHSEYLKEISFSETLPQNYKESPVIIVSKSVGNIELETSSYLELFEFFEVIK